jgi:hypothetical protein
LVDTANRVGSVEFDAILAAERTPPNGASFGNGGGPPPKDHSLLEMGRQALLTAVAQVAAYRQGVDPLLVDSARADGAISDADDDKSGGTL